MKNYYTIIFIIVIFHIKNYYLSLNFIYYYLRQETNVKGILVKYIRKFKYINNKYIFTRKIINIIVLFFINKF